MGGRPPAWGLSHAEGSDVKLGLLRRWQRATWGPATTLTRERVAGPTPELRWRRREHGTHASWRLGDTKKLEGESKNAGKMSHASSFARIDAATTYFWTGVVCDTNSSHCLTSAARDRAYLTRREFPVLFWTGDRRHGARPLVTTHTTKSRPYERGPSEFRESRRPRQESRPDTRAKARTGQR